jgi:hypothetical protein
MEGMVQRSKSLDSNDVHINCNNNLADDLELFQNA